MVKGASQVALVMKNLSTNAGDIRYAGLIPGCPLFPAWAWQCLRLGLAFRVVDIPQSGLLAQIISLR